MKKNTFEISFPKNVKIETFLPFLESKMYKGEREWIQIFKLQEKFSTTL